MAECKRHGMVMSSTWWKGSFTATRRQASTQSFDYYPPLLQHAATSLEAASPKGGAQQKGDRAAPKSRLSKLSDAITKLMS